MPLSPATAALQPFLQEYEKDRAEERIEAAEEAAEAFDRIDTNHDGEISKAEWEAHREMHPEPTPAMIKERITSKVNKAVSSGKVPRERAESLINEMFSKLVKDQSPSSPLPAVPANLLTDMPAEPPRAVSFAEIKTEILTDIGPQSTAAKVTFDEMDKNQDGAISKAAFQPHVLP